MKNSKGETLPQPYYDLALMRREQNKFFSNEKYLASSFSWVDTLEGSKFWAKVSNGNIPEIPAASLAELEAWRKSREENKQSEFWGKAAMVADELRDEPVSESKFKAGDKVRIISDTLNHKFKIGEIVILDQINTSGMSWRCHDLCKKDWWNVAISDMELVENAPDTTDYKAMYESEKEKAEYYEKQYNVLKDAVITPTAELQPPSRNWIAECAMAAMHGLLSDPNYKDVQHAKAGNIVTKPRPEVIAKISFDYAEALAAEGKKRNHL